MRISTTTLTACLAAFASARLVARDLSEVKTVLSTVTDNVNTLDSAVTSYDGSSDPVIDASKKLVSSIKNGTQVVDKTDALDSSDAIGLVGPLTTLQNKGEQLAADLKCQRPAIEKGKLCSQTRDQVTQINDASQALVKSAISKIPKGLQSISTTLSQSLTDTLNDVQDYFSEDNCKDGGSGDSSSTASACSASATASSSGTTSSSMSASGSSAAPSASTSTTPADSAAFRLSSAGSLGTAAVSFLTICLSLI